jgi:hypothetical protein
MRSLLKSSLLIRTLTIDNIKPLLRNLESLDDFFARFESIVRSLYSCGHLAYSDNECTKQLMYALDDHVWGMKITALEEPVDFATLDTEKLFSKLKSHELSTKVVLTMMPLLLVRLLLLLLVLVVMMLTPPTPLSYILWSLPYPL